MRRSVKAAVESAIGSSVNLHHEMESKHERCCFMMTARAHSFPNLLYKLHYSSAHSAVLTVNTRQLAKNSFEHRILELCYQSISALWKEVQVVFQGLLQSNTISSELSEHAKIVLLTVACQQARPINNHPRIPRSNLQTCKHTKKRCHTAATLHLSPRNSTTTHLNSPTLRASTPANTSPGSTRITTSDPSGVAGAERNDAIGKKKDGDLCKRWRDGTANIQVRRASTSRTRPSHLSDVDTVEIGLGRLADMASRSTQTEEILMT